MDVASWTQLISTIALIIGVAFTAVQVHHLRVERGREATLELVHSFETPEFAKAIYLLSSIPEGLSREELEEHLGRDMESIYLLLTTWESLGILVFQGEVSLDLVDDFFSGPLVLSWSRLGEYVLGTRRELERETYNEWFQWLAERMEERESSSPPVPAHVAHADWEPGGS